MELQDIMSKEGKVASARVVERRIKGQTWKMQRPDVNKAVKGLGTDEDMQFSDHLGKLKTYLR